VHVEARAIAAEADALRERFLEARSADEAAFRAVIAAQGLPRGSDTEQALRRTALQSALTGAAEAPLEAARLAAAGIALTVRAGHLGNANLMSDVVCSRTFARAAFDASVTNVEVNHRYMTDAKTVERQRERLRELETLAAAEA
jgi:formiminotetrahydrofolate cyclodeaminase